MDSKRFRTPFNFHRAAFNKGVHDMLSLSFLTDLMSGRRRAGLQDILDRVEGLDSPAFMRAERAAGSAAEALALAERELAQLKEDLAKAGFKGGRGR